MSNAIQTRVEGVAALARAIERFVRRDGDYETAVPGLALFRATRPTPLTPVVYPPSLCVIAQGQKRVHLADQLYVYDAAHFLLVAADVPVLGQITRATPTKPYLSLRLELDPATVGELLAARDSEEEPGRVRAPAPSRAVVVTPAAPVLLDALTRLVDLLVEPTHVSALAPLIKREITYRLLIGPQGPRLRQIAASDGQGQRVASALRWLQDHFSEPLTIDALASRAHMSPSALHHHFKTVTAMSPLQYQKSLRLQEARRLMLAEGLDAAEAGFRVGYESATQFSREYRRRFGAPPRRDISELQQSSAASPG